MSLLTNMVAILYEQDNIFIFQLWYIQTLKTPGLPISHTEAGKYEHSPVCTKWQPHILRIFHILIYTRLDCKSHNDWIGFVWQAQGHSVSSTVCSTTLDPLHLTNGIICIHVMCSHKTKHNSIQGISCFCLCASTRLFIFIMIHSEPAWQCGGAHCKSNKINTYIHTSIFGLCNPIKWNTFLSRYTIHKILNT